MRIRRARRDEVLAAAVLVEGRARGGVDGCDVAAGSALASVCAELGRMNIFAVTVGVKVSAARCTLARTVRVFCAGLALPRVVRALVLETCRAAVLVDAVAIPERREIITTWVATWVHWFRCREIAVRIPKA